MINYKILITVEKEFGQSVFHLVSQCLLADRLTQL